MQTIRDHSFPCLITVTTSTATNLYPTNLLSSIQTDKLDTAGIQKLCNRETVKGIIDASHPFAVNISRQAMQDARQEGIPYLRYERPLLTNNSYPIYLDSLEDLITGNYLQNKRVWHQQATLYTRILPKLDSLEMALKAGFPASQIIALRPPISLQLERTLWQQWGINLVFTKASGKQGGENIKVQVAQALGIPLIIIKRPLLNYPQQTEQLSDIIEFCYQCFK